MPAEEIEVKGIVLSVFPQGEYGRRLLLLTDRLGKLTVFASGAAKTGSHLIGATRPMTCAHFLIAKGRDAWSLHGVRLIASFDALTRSMDGMLYAMYFLEFAAYFAQEGMEEREAKAMLNLIYVALSALQSAACEPSGAALLCTVRKKTPAISSSDQNVPGCEEAGKLAAAQNVPAQNASAQQVPQARLFALIRANYELRMLVIEGEYTEQPLHARDEAVSALWRYAIKAPLKKLFDFSEIPVDERAAYTFIEETKSLLRRQIPHAFRSLNVLEELADSGAAAQI